MTEPQIFEAFAALGLSPSAFEEVFQTAAFGIYIDHVDKGCIYANDVLCETFGMDWSQMQGWGWARAVHPDDAERMRHEIERFENERGWIDIRYRILRGDTGDVRHVHARVKALSDANGEQTGAFGITRDITLEIELELRRGQSQKLEAIGRLSGRVAHDFNNVLASIVMSAGMLETSELSPDNRTFVSTILEATQHATAVTRQLLGLARQQVVGTATCRLDEEIERQSTLIGQAVGDGIALTLDLKSCGATVALAPHELGQVMLNLCVNARDALAGKGSIFVTTRESEGTVQLFVRDTGAGIPVDVQQRMFDPFYTTKPEGRGTGLGLSTVSDLVKRAGGTIAASSQLGQGTTFTLALPTAITMPTPGSHTSAEPKLDPLRILLVDDNAALRQTLAFALSQRGHEVSMAASVAAATQHLGRSTFDVIVTDALLPDGNGTAVVDKARARISGLPAVYISGFVGELDLALDARTAFLQKPFVVGELVSVIGATLARAIDSESA